MSGSLLTRRICAALALVSLVATVAVAGPPPAGSPIANGQHPRLLFTQGDIPAIRSWIAANYRTEFQDLLDLMVDPSSRLDPKVRDIEANWGAVNYAFVAALDPAQLASLGFRIPSSYPTAASMCDKSMAYAGALLPSIAAVSIQGHDVVAAGYPSPYYFPVALAYDWCYAYTPVPTRMAIADAFVAVFNANYLGKNFASMSFGSNSGLANNQNSSRIHELLGILAFYGDSYPDIPRQQAMYDAFDGIWVKRLFFELNTLYGDATNWHEGPGGYLEEGTLNLGIPVAMFSTALGVDFIGGTPFFSTYAQSIQALLNPHGRLSQCGSGTARCPAYLLRFGETGGGIAEIKCKSMALIAGMFRTRDAVAASQAKWLYEDVNGKCGRAISDYGGVWSNGVIFWFLFGDKTVSKLPPLGGWPSRTRLGLGQYVFQAGTTQVGFAAQPYMMYGHGMKAFGHFTIHKYGELILKPANAKSGDGRISGEGFNLMQNTVGIHKAVPDPNMGEDGGVNDPVWLAAGLQQKRTGVVRAEIADGSTFSYVFYDGSQAWKASTADVMHREFVYLRGPENSEYAIVLDRVRTPTPQGNEKVWKVWVPTQPRFVNGAVSQPRAGKWASVSTDQVEITNDQTGLTTPNFESAPTHGRLYLRTLSPQLATVSAQGGPGREFQSGDDDGTTPWGTPELTPAMQAYLGWGRIEIRPSVSQAYDVFLNVMQFGDSRSLNRMTASTRLRSAENSHIGAHVEDPQNEWVVLFAETPEQVFTTSRATYTFRPAGARSSHLVVDLVPSQTYYVSHEALAEGTRVTVTPDNRAGATSVRATGDGVVSFELSGQVVVPRQAPGSPRNVRIR